MIVASGILIKNFTQSEYYKGVSKRNYLKEQEALKNE